MNMEFKEVKCKGCETNKSPIFLRGNARSADDFWCKTCMDEGKHID